MAGRVRLAEVLKGLPRYVQLLTRLVRDPRVSAADKALLAGTIAYALTPYDLLPDFLPVVGQLDDLFLLALTIDRLVRRAGPELVAAHWDGSAAALAALSGSLDELARRLPERVRGRLGAAVEGR